MFGTKHDSDPDLTPDPDGQVRIVTNSRCLRFRSITLRCLTLAMLSGGILTGVTLAGAGTGHQFVSIRLFGLGLAGTVVLVLLGILARLLAEAERIRIDILARFATTYAELITLRGDVEALQQYGTGIHPLAVNDPLASEAHVWDPDSPEGRAYLLGVIDRERNKRPDQDRW